MGKTIFISVLLTLFATSVFAQNISQKRILVFSKTAGFRHASIKEGKQFFLDLGKKQSIAVDTSENSEVFAEANLKKYSAVVFLSTTGDVLNQNQQTAFERYIQAGGGYMGVHAASDTEYDWSWYNDLMGGYFASHPGNPNVQNGKMITMDKNHPSTAHLPETFERKDEFYDFKSLRKDILKFLVKVDEGSYKDGKMGDFHPMSWYHEFDGGKAFYTNYGHTPETFSEPLMIEHFWGGLKYVMTDKLDYSKAYAVGAPEENRFERTTLIGNLNEPTELATMPNGKVIFVERKGVVRVYLPATGVSKIVAQMPVYTKFEYGLMGVGVDPKFDKNNWIYLFYTPDDSREVTKDQFLSRFVYDNVNDTLLLNTEKVVLRFPVKRDECCHTGGSIDFDKDGNLFLSSGDDTNPFASDGFAPMDFQKDRSGWDAMRSSSNTNDLRGKILRIKPTDEGSYTIPKGNLFAEGTEKARPEIYVMGCRNPYRISVDKRNGYLYWGDVGPDAGKAKADRGPDGLVEFNQARKAGYFGWPMFTGNNSAYTDYNFETKISGAKFDPKAPKNMSPNNTGLIDLPPTTPAWIWYGYGDSKEFSWVDKGGANPMGGPVYYSEDYKDSKDKLPKYYDGKFFAYEWMRDWVYTVSMDKEGNYTGAERFMPNTKFNHPMDMGMGHDGSLYVLDYGLNWFVQNEEATLSRITFNPGNRKPLVKIAASKKVGAAPLMVDFSSAGTIDYDNDAISYSWNFGDGTPLSILANPKKKFKKAGEYTVVLTVSDDKGNKKTESTIIKVGNAEPEVSIALQGNKSFFLDDNKINYAVNVKDKEDGKLGKGISNDDVVVNISYLEGYDKTMLEQGHKSNVTFAVGKRLIELSDCKSCHAMDKKSIGPTYMDIAKKYPTSRANIQLLAAKIQNGGGGVWGEQAMAAHPQINDADARKISEYILTLKDAKKASLPLQGIYETADHKDKKDGAYIIQASYSDKGNKGASSLSMSNMMILRSPKVRAIAYDDIKGAMKYTSDKIGDVVAVGGDNAFINFKDIDLTGINALNLAVFSIKGSTVGGTIEVRLGSPTGILLGTAEVPEASFAPIKIPLNKPPQAPTPQTLYFVFRNPKNDGKPLMALNTIEFLVK